MKNTMKEVFDKGHKFLKSEEVQEKTKQVISYSTEELAVIKNGVNELKDNDKIKEVQNKTYNIVSKLKEDLENKTNRINSLTKRISDLEFELDLAKIANEELHANYNENISELTRKNVDLQSEVEMQQRIIDNIPKTFIEKLKFLFKF